MSVKDELFQELENVSKKVGKEPLNDEDYFVLFLGALLESYEE